MTKRVAALSCLTVLLGLALSVVFPAEAQTDYFDYYFPVPVPYYAGENFDLAVMMSQGQFSDVASVYPMLFHRPLDSIGPRPGADAWGMGGAHLALTDGPQAMGWNPAALGYLREPAVSLDAIRKTSSGSGTALPDTVHIEGQPEFGIDTYDWKLAPLSGFGFFGGAMPLTDLGGRPLVGGLSYRRSIEAAWAQETLLEMGLLEGTGFPFVVGLDSSEWGSIESLTASLGYELVGSEQVSVSVGGSANFLRGRIRTRITTDVAVRDFEPGVLSFQKDAKGFSFEGGIQARIMDLVRVAGWASLPYSLEIYNSRFTDVTIVTPDASFGFRTFGEVADYDIEVPMFLSAGVAVGPIKGITIAADLNQRNWSEAEIKHKLEEYQVFDGPYPGPDLTSYHLGAEFEFPLLKGAIHRRGMELYARAGYRTIPLSMYDLDPVNGDAPYYLGDPIEGSGYSLGFSLLTDAQIDFNLSMEFQSYKMRRWFLDDTRDIEERELTFNDPYDRAPVIDLKQTMMRVSSTWRL